MLPNRLYAQNSAQTHRSSRIWSASPNGNPLRIVISKDLCRRDPSNGLRLSQEFQLSYELALNEDLRGTFLLIIRGYKKLLAFRDLNLDDPAYFP